VAELKRRSGERGPREDRGVLSARIVAAARASFAEHGWAGTTMRGVARDAGVDPALVHYYFGSKEDLIEASTTPPPEWMEAMQAAVTSPEQTRGEAIVRNVMWVYRQPELADLWRSVLLAAAHEPRTREKIVQIVASSIVPAVASTITKEERILRASLVASQTLGMVMMRYIWRIEPLASLPDEEIVALVPSSAT
jgi:AcrR family transcriptional regulator